MTPKGFTGLAIAAVLSLIVAGYSYAAHNNWGVATASGMRFLPGLEGKTKDIAKIGNFSSYVEANGMVPRKLETFRDSIALQFPVKHPDGTKKPHFEPGIEVHAKYTIFAEGARGSLSKRSRISSLAVSVSMVGIFSMAPISRSKSVSSSM